MSLWSELKRRKVFKVGAAYLVVAWLLIQVVATVSPQLNLPEWAPRLITFVILLGFPVALVLAWILESTPGGLRLESAPTGNKRMYAVAALLAALAAGWYIRGLNPPAAGTVAPADGPATLAVLPFANLSSDAEQEFFSDGMTEELLNVLARLPSLKVAARTSVFEFKGKGGDVREIGAKLGVTHIVEGSVRREGTRVRVTAQLIRVADGFHLWSETYDRELKGVFALQDEIAGRIAGQLQGSLTGGAVPAARPDIDPAAYDAYLKARVLHRARGNLPQAIALLELAVQRAPRFAAAWASLSLAHEVAHWRVTPLQRQALGPARPQMLAAAERAAALDPDAATTLHALGNVARGDGRYAQAEDLYRRAIAVDSTYADVREDLAELLLGVGRDADALAAARELVALEPLVGIFWYRIADIAATNDDEALLAEAQSHMAEIDPDELNAHMAAIWLHLNHGRLDRARALFEVARERAPVAIAEEWVMFRWSQGDPAIDDRVARAAAEASIVYAIYAALRGDADLFFASIGVQSGTPVAYSIYVQLRVPVVQRHLADPRAKALLRQHGFEAYWREKGWPPLCRPLGADDFECGPESAEVR